MGTSTLADIQYRAHKKYLNSRNIDHLSLTEGFIGAFSENQTALVTAVNRSDLKAVKKLITEYELSQKQWTELRLEAKKQGIKYYSKMTKEKLMKELGYV